MSSRARMHMMLFSAVLIFIIVFGAVGVLVYMPVHVSGTRQLAVLLVGNVSAGIGTASSQATVHYDDGSTQDLSGSTITLLPVFQQSGVTLNKNPVSADWAAQVVYIPNFNLNDYCRKVLFLFNTCPVDAVLIVDTNIGIAVDGNVVAQSPSNGRTVAYSTTGYIAQATADLGLGGMTPVFQTGKTVTTFNLPSFDVTPYRQAGKSVTVALTGTQTFRLYPIFVAATGGFRVDSNTNIICGDAGCTKPYVVNYNDPSFQIPSTTVTTPDYQLSVSPAALTMSTNPANDGNLGFVKVAALAYNDLTGTFHVGAMTGAPDGVTMTFDTANDQQVTSSNSLVGVRLKFATAASTTVGNYTLTIPTTVGSVSHSITLPVTINAGVSSCPSGASCPTIATVLTAQLSQTQVSAYFPFQVTGTLQTTGGGPVPAGAIYVQPTWGNGVSGASGNDGKFSITVTAPSTPGTYDLHVSFPGDSQYSAAEPVTLRITVRQVDWTTILIIVAVIAVIIMIGLAYAMSHRAKPGGMP